MEYRSRNIRIALTCICLALSLLSFWIVGKIVQSRATDSFNAVTNDYASALNQRFELYLQSLIGLSGLFIASDSVTQADIRDYASQVDIDENLPGLLGIGYIQPIRRDELDGFIAQTRADGVSDFDVHPRRDAGELFVIKYIEPVERNREARGLDIGFEEGRRLAAIDARDSGKPRITPRAQLVQDKAGQAGFLMLYPVYDLRRPTETPEQRSAAFRGWTYAPILGARLLDAVLPNQGAKYSVSVYDGEGTDAERLIYTSANADAARYSPGYSRNAQVDLFGRTWTMHWESTRDFDLAQPFRAPYIVLAIGLLITVLVNRILMLVERNEAQIREQIAEKTLALKTREDDYRSVVENAQIGILTLNSVGEITQINEAAVDLLGGSRGDFTGQKVDTVLPGVGASQSGGRYEYLSPEGERIFDYRQDPWRSAQGEHCRTLLLRDITEQEANFARIRETEKRWHLALKGAQIGVFDIDLATGKSVVSDSWRQIMGVPLDNAEFDPQRLFVSRVHPEDFVRLKQADADCIQGRTVRSTCQYRVLFGKDEWRWMRSDATVVDWDDDGKALRFVGAQVDITDQINAQADLRLSQERFRVIFENAPVGNAVIEASSGSVSVNQALSKFLGYTAGELKNSVRMRDVLSRPDLTSVLREIRASRQAGAQMVQMEKEFIHKDGTLRWGLLSISWTLDERAGGLVYIVQINDISEIRDLERSKSEFVTTISHELRTPLTSIRGALELMGSEKIAAIPQKRNRLLDIARINSDRLLNLVNDALDLEKILSKKLEYDFSEEPVADLLASALARNATLAQETQVTLAAPEAEDGLVVRVDRYRLGQVLDNLISNACKFSEEEGVVRIEAAGAGPFVRFSVTNRGEGIPESVRGRLFRPFSRLDNTDTRATGGTGLGLSIAKQIVRQMGGTIGFESEPGGDTTFWFTCVRGPETTDSATIGVGNRAVG